MPYGCQVFYVKTSSGRFGCVSLFGIAAIGAKNPTTRRFLFLPIRLAAGLCEWKMTNVHPILTIMTEIFKIFPQPIN